MKPSSLTYKTAETDDEMQQILDLQAKYLRHKNTAEEESKNGFVTLRHTLEILKTMNQKEPHVIVKDNNKVIAYALAMSKKFRIYTPILDPLFDMVDSLTHHGRIVGNDNYLVMGQVCVDEDYRGQGVFENMYAFYFNEYKAKYDWILTEISTRNTRSMRAHQKVGFEEIFRYDDPGMEEWSVVIY